MKRLLVFLLILLPLSARFRWITDAEVGIKLPFSLRSPSDYYSEVFKIPFVDYLKPGNSILRIRYTVLDTNARRFFLRISLNYHTLYRGLINDSTGILSMNFPTTWIRKYNRLDFYLDGPISYGVRDIVEIDSISIGADIERKSITLKNLSQFVDLSFGNLYLVAPEKASVKTLSALSLFAQAVGFLYRDSAKLHFETNPAGVRKGGIVVIGTPEEQPYISELLGKIRQDAGLTIGRGYKGKFIWQTSGGENIGKKSGVLILLINNAGVPVLVISSARPEGIKKGISALLDNSFQLKQNHAIITASKDIFIKQKWVAPPEGDFSLKDLNWPDVQIKGREVDTSLVINFLPGTRFPPQSGYFRLRIKNSKLLDPFTSKLTFSFNGQLLGTYYASQLGHEIKLRIPGETLRGNNYFGIKAELRSISKKTEPSIFIDRKSTFEIARSWKVTLPELSYLKDLAFPFGATYRGLRTAIVVDHYSPEKLALAIAFSRFIGLTGVVNSDIVLSPADSTKKYAKGRNLVLIGHDFDILSPADSSLYVEELIYPEGKVFRTFLVLHAVDEDGFAKLSEIFATREGVSILSGQRVNLAPLKYVEAFKKFTLKGRAKRFNLKIYAVIVLAIVVLFFIIRSVLTSA